MSITVEETTSGGADGGALPLTLTLSTAPDDGDLLVAGVVLGYANTCTPPSGWTQVDSYYGSGSNPDPRLAVYWKIASSEGTTFDFTPNAGDVAGVLLRASSTTGWQSTAIDQTANYYNSSDVSSRSTNTTSTTTQADELVFYVCAISNYDIGSTIGWTNGTVDETYYGVSAVYRAIGLAHEIASSTGTFESTASWTTAHRAVAAVSTYMVAAGGIAFTLTPNADGSRSVVENESAGTTNLWMSVDDSPDTPDTDDWLTTNQSDGYVFLDFTDTAPDFSSIQDSGSLTARAYLTSTGYTTDTCTVYAQVFKSDESTNLTDEITLGTQATSGLVEIDFTVNATGLAASKTDWDAARTKVRWDYTA